MMGTETLGSALAARFDEEDRYATAIENPQGSISYARLSAASRSIADDLLRLGVKKGAHVGVIAEDQSIIVPAVIGVLARECIFALLDPAHPAAYLRDLGDAADLEYVFVEDKLASVAEEVWRGRSCKIVHFNSLVFSIDDPQLSVSPLLAQATELPLYLYFSAGTTGKPKPILGRADSLLHFVKWEIETLGLGSTVRISQLTSPSHDPYLRDVFTPLVAGGTICIPCSKQIVLSPFELGQWLDHAQIQLVHCTPTVFRNLCNGDLADRTFESLKHVVLAGEQLRGAHVAAWYKAFGDRIQLVNLYGPTETTLAKFYYFVSPEDALRAVVPIGRPMDGVRFKIMATPSRECVDGEIGELYIETAFGTLGYYGNPILNREAFEPDPSNSTDRPVVYKTGDLVKRLPDGNIEFFGRKDRKHKVRGKLVDSGRVEDEVVRHPGVDSCVVSAVTDGDGRQPDRLVIYYVAGLEIDQQALKQHLERELPQSMIPDVWIRIESLPTYMNGKLHGAELAVLLSRHESSQRQEPRLADEAGTRTIGRLLGLWKEILQNETIGVDDAFMDIGGNSLTIMLLITRLEEEFGYNLSLWQIFEDLTIRKLSSLIDGASEG